MKQTRPLYAACPRCGTRADIRKRIWDGEEDLCYALVRCGRCGQSTVPYLEHRIVPVDLNNPYMPEEHYDLLLPPGWTPEMWSRFSTVLTGGQTSGCA